MRLTDVLCAPLLTDNVTAALSLETVTVFETAPVICEPPDVSIFRLTKPDVEEPYCPDGKPLRVNVEAVWPPGAGDCVGVALAVGNGVGVGVAVCVGVGVGVCVGALVGVDEAVGTLVGVPTDVGGGVVTVDDGTGVGDELGDGDADTDGPADGVALLVELDVGPGVGEIPGDGVGAVPPLYNA